MDNMILFSQTFFADLATFLATPPVFYLFGLILLCFVCKAVRILIKF